MHVGRQESLPRLPYAGLFPEQLFNFILDQHPIGPVMTQNRSRHGGQNFFVDVTRTGREEFEVSSHVGMSP